MKAGFIGTGNMGLPLAANILAQESSLVAYDIVPEATTYLADRQARIVDSPKEVADESDVVFACMPSVASFHDVAYGKDGVIHGDQMKLFVNLGTMGTEAVGAIEAEMAEHGIPMLDSPITGGTKRAWDRNITVISSGPKAVFEQVEPFLKAFAGEIVYVGDKVGQAQIVKIVNNILSMTNLVIGCEGLVMAAKAGIDPLKLLEVVNIGSGQNSATLAKIPGFVLNRKFDMEAPMYISEKDATLWRMEAERLEVPQMVASATYQTLMQALAMGMGPGDLSEIIKVVERAADFELPEITD
jgi:3-hydroxyisobutyrate dehydrogenase-like beta-hydroxyacid dehydrogenase